MLCEAQKKMLLEFMNQHEELRAGKFTSKFTYKTAQQLWETISNKLNSVPNGGKKDWKKWRKTWQDMKKGAKAKNAAIKKYAQGTGGGPIYSKNLNDIETEVLDMISPIQTSGLGVGETTVEFSFNDEVEATTGEYTASPEPSTKIDDNVTDKDAWPTGEILILQNELIQPSTINSRVGISEVEVENIESRHNEEHNYNLTYPTNKNRRGPPKKISQTSRLQTSIKLSQLHLKSLDERNSVLAQYYKNKILVENRKIRTQLRIHKFSNIWWKNLFF